jgi:histidine triad (HIT) family protein
MKTDPDCIFCKIVAGDIPAEKIIEDGACLAFMDIGPLAEGHVLLIPKEHFVTADEMPADTAGAMLRHVPALVKAVQAATDCEGVNVLQNNGKVAHQVVPHVHFHVIPRNPGDAFEFNWPAGEYPQGRMQQLAESIRKAMP